MLGITVWLNGENVEVTGTIDPGIVLTPLFAGYSPFSGGEVKLRAKPQMIRGRLGWEKISNG